MKYIPVIGLEIHAELLTKSKAFCSCENSFGGKPNSRVCPVCMGFPGALPSLNKEAVTLAIRAGAALGCKIHEYSAFDRKNYFYPDLPKAYQITQFEHPICTGGEIKLSKKVFHINRIHIEEDAGKLIHNPNDDTSAVDYNRCGVGLIEIVTEPDFGNGEEVKQFVEEIALRLKYAKVCDGRLEQGSLRTDVNISIMREGDKAFGTRAEIKNLNSLKSIGRAIDYEIKRQSEILKSGGRVIQETRRFDEGEGRTKSMRSKEEIHDYRYFPEPDIPPIIVNASEIEKIKRSLPEMPSCRIDRYINKFKLQPDDAKLIASDKEFSDFYDLASCGCDARELARLMLGALNRVLNKNKKSVSEIIFSPEQLAALCKMSSDGKISKNAANDILAIMFQSGENPEKIASERGWLMDNDEEKINALVDKILAKNKENVISYKNGNVKLFGYFMGQLVRIGGKSINPKLAKAVLEKKLNEATDCIV